MTSGLDRLEIFIDTDFSDPKILNHKPFKHRRTTIIATFDNASITLVDIHTIMETGMTVARILPYKSTTGDKVELLKKLDQATKYLAQKYGLIEWPCATCIQLKTCLVKTGILEQGEEVFMEHGSQVTVTCNTAEYDRCNATRIFIDNPYLTTEAEIGMEINLRGDEVILEVNGIDVDKVTCTVIKAGMLQNMDRVCMRGVKRTRPLISKKDLELAQLAIEHKVNMLSILYVRHPDTIKQLKQFMGDKKNRPYILCGVCTNEGLCNIDDIIKEADGIIIPREYLAFELDRSMFYRMDRIQKWIVGKCRQAGKPVYVSGGVFESLFETDVLEGRDLSDVTNNLLQGVAGFILRPCDKPENIRSVIRELNSLCTQVEPLTNDKVDFRRKIDELHVPINAALASVLSCVMMANETQARMIVIPTVSGRTIYYINAMRTVCLILAVTSNVETFRSLQINRSVVPLLYAGAPCHTWQKTITERLNFAIEHALNKNWLVYGNSYITLQKGAELSAYCDTVSVYTVETEKKTLVSCDDDAYDSHSFNN